MFDLEKKLQETRKLAVLCIGDLMLDDFVYGEVSRISPEAPAPVIAVQREEIVIGGAGNVARNIAALGAKCIFIGIVGNDEAGAVCRASFRKYPKASRPIWCPIPRARPRANCASCRSISRRICCAPTGKRRGRRPARSRRRSSIAR